MNHYLKRVLNNNLSMNTTDKEVSARSYILKKNNEKNKYYQGSID
jgi:hypothetical protein